MEDGFFGKQQKVKMTSKGRLIGTLSVTFRRKVQGERLDDGNVSDWMPITGVEEDSSLSLAIRQAWTELSKAPNFVQPEAKLEGDHKIFLLSKVLTDELREVSKSGKELGRISIRVINANFADLQGDRRE